MTPFFGSKNTRFPCENANLPHCTYFTHIRRGGGVKPNFADKNFMDTQTFLTEVATTVFSPFFARHSRKLNSRNCTHELSCVKTPIRGAALRATLGSGWTPQFQAKVSEHFVQKWGGSRAPDWETDFYPVLVLGGSVFVP